MNFPIDFIETPIEICVVCRQPVEARSLTGISALPVGSNHATCARCVTRILRAASLRPCATDGCPCLLTEEYIAESGRDTCAICVQTASYSERVRREGDRRLLEAVRAEGRVNA